MEEAERLRKSLLFGGFERQDVQAFLDATEVRCVPKDHVFLRMGNPNSALFVVRSGSVSVERIGVEKDVHLATIGPGETFGEMSLLEGGVASATVRAAEPTEVLELSSERLNELLSDQPELAAKLWRNIALELKRRLALTNELVDHYIDVADVLVEHPDYREVLGRG